MPRCRETSLSNNRKLHQTRSTNQFDNIVDDGILVFEQDTAR